MILPETFFISGDALPISVEGTYILSYVLLSYVIASFGAFVGLTLASDMFRAKSPDVKNLLHFGAAFGLGAGIWSMHFIGMLAFRMDMVVTYDPGLTALSMAIAVLVAFFAFLITRAEKFSIGRVAFAAVILGLAICAMHYTGMAAMKMDSDLRYVPSIFFLSVAVAIAGSGAALAIIHFLGRYKGRRKRRTLWIILAALVMGGAVCGMHYTGMAAAVFIPHGNHDFQPDQRHHTLALSVAAITSVLFAMALSLLVYGREQEAQKVDATRDNFPTKVLTLSSFLSIVFVFWLVGSELYFEGIAAETVNDPELYALYTTFAALAVLSVLWIFSYRGLRQWRKDLVRTRNDLNTEKGQLSAIMNVMMQGVITIDSSGTIKSANKWAVETFGYDMDELVGRNVNFLMPEPHRTRHDQYLKNYLQTGVAKIIGSERTLVGRRKSGTEFPMSLSVTETKAGDSHLFVGLFRDISEQLARETELTAAKEQAEKASQAKSDFLANMSHELRTPLNSILGMVRMLMEDDGLSADDRDMAGIIHKSAISLLETVNDILDLSKIEAGGMVLERTNFDIKTTVTSILETMAPIASANGISLNCRYEKDKIPYLVGDPLRVGRILMNLLGNAIKYTHKGRVDISVDCTPLPPASDGGVEIQCIVRDTGVGIPKDKLDVIFDKFTQADESTTRKYGGTGLGLSIAKDLIEMMGGRIGVESKVGIGSTFWFKIPFKTADRVDAGARRHTGGQHRGEPGPKKSVAAVTAEKANVLVAEDHPLNQIFIQRLLSRMGIGGIKIAENGRLAVEAYAGGHYDLILMDCHMPEKSGYEATREIRKNEAPGKHVPIVALTADAMAGTRTKCLEAGMDEYVTKPVDIDYLREVLGQWIVLTDPHGGDTEKTAAEKTPDEEKEKAAEEEQQPVDLSVLKAYTDTPEELRQYIDVFITQAAADLKTLARHCTDGENKAWVETAHKMKGGAGMAGAAVMQRLCARAQAMNDATLQERAALLKEIGDAFKKAKTFLEQAKTSLETTATP